MCCFYFFFNCKLSQCVPFATFSYLQISRYHDYQKVIKIKPSEFFCGNASLSQVSCTFNAQKLTYSLNSSKRSRNDSSNWTEGIPNTELLMLKKWFNYFKKMYELRGLNHSKRWNLSRSVRGRNSFLWPNFSQRKEALN